MEYREEIEYFKQGYLLKTRISWYFDRCLYRISSISMENACPGQPSAFVSWNHWFVLSSENNVIDKNTISPTIPTNPKLVYSYIYCAIFFHHYLRHDISQLSPRRGSGDQSGMKCTVFTGSNSNSLLTINQLIHLLIHTHTPIKLMIMINICLHISCQRVRVFILSFHPRARERERNRTNGGRRIICHRR